MRRMALALTSLSLTLLAPPASARRRHTTPPPRVATVPLSALRARLTVRPRLRMRQPSQGRLEIILRNPGTAPVSANLVAFESAAACCEIVDASGVAVPAMAAPEARRGNPLSAVMLAPNGTVRFEYSLGFNTTALNPGVYQVRLQPGLEMHANTVRLTITR